jgi:predicted GIY-YIG superfamily endonuclease
LRRAGLVATAAGRVLELRPDFQADGAGLGDEGVDLAEHRPSDQFYTGLCKDVESRLASHNAGQSPHTAKFKPWRPLSYQWFARPETAAAFERYLKSGSGRAFASKRLR